MSEIADYERRITAALERIGRGIDGLRAAAPAGAAPADADAGEAEALREALEAERAANAQLTERVRAIKEKQETMVSALEKKVARLTHQLEAASLDMQRQKRVNAQLADTVQSLRAAAAEGSAEAHLIDKAMHAELEALRAARAAEMAEMEEILQELKPMLGEAADA